MQQRATTQSECPYCQARRNNSHVISWKCIRGHVGNKGGR